MHRMMVTITALAMETRLLVQDEMGDRLIAKPQPLPCAHPAALRTLLEALALWWGKPLRVVLFADDTSDWERLGLVDALGFGCETLHYEVEVVPLAPHRRPRPKRLSGLGNFSRERKRLRETRQ